MSDSEIYCALAEFEGWMWVDGWHHPLYPNQVVGPPNYLTDLNATYSVEERLSEKQAWSFMRKLMLGTLALTWNHVHIDARKRAEALAEVIKEGKP